MTGSSNTAGDGDARAASDAGDLEALAAEQLDSVRRTAENWRTGLAGLLALVATILFLKGPDSISKLESWVRWSLSTMLVICLGIALAAAWLALRAAFGTPRVVDVAEIEREGGVKPYRAGLARRAVEHLNWSKRLTVSAAVILSAVTVLYWNAPLADERNGYLRVSLLAPSNQAAPPPICGRPQRVENQRLYILEADGALREITLSSVAGLSVVAEC